MLIISVNIEKCMRQEEKNMRRLTICVHLKSITWYCINTNENICTRTSIVRSYVTERNGSARQFLHHAKIMENLYNALLILSATHVVEMSLCNICTIYTVHLINRIYHQYWILRLIPDNCEFQHSHRKVYLTKETPCLF